MKKYIDLFFGLIIIIYCIVINMISTSKIAFSTPLIGFGFILIIFHFIKGKIKVENKLLKLTKIVIAIGISVILILEICIIAYPKHSKDNSDYLIVLGAGLNGSTVSQTLKDRLNVAIKCIDDYGNDSYIVVSGGQGKNEDISEAEAMKEYLLSNGVEENKIIIENKSSNTFENLKFSKEKIEEHSGKNIKDISVKIVTTDFHSFRSKILSIKNGYGEVKLSSSNTIGYLIPIYYLRESFALVKSIIFD